jgi:hypothetical protein
MHCNPSARPSAGLFTVGRMTVAISIASVVVSIGALYFAFRSDRRADEALRMTRDEREERLRERAAKAVLGLRFRPGNVPVDADGVIQTEASIQYVNLEITVENTGEKPAGETQVEAWVPKHISSTTLRWLDDAAVEDRTHISAPDPSTALPVGDGRSFDAQRITRSLEAVPLMGKTIYLRLACPMEGPGEGMIPVRVRARTDGSEVDDTYPIRLRRV